MEQELDELTEATQRVQIALRLNDQATAQLQVAMQHLAYAYSPPYMAQRSYGGHSHVQLWTSLENGDEAVEDVEEPVRGQQALALILDEVSEAGVMIEDDTQFLARLRRLPSKRGTTKIPIEVVESGSLLYVERRRLEKLVEQGHSVARALRMLVEDQVCGGCLQPDPQRTGPSLCPDCELDVIGDLLALRSSLP